MILLNFLIWYFIGKKNRVYKVSGVGLLITWRLQSPFGPRSPGRVPIEPVLGRGVLDVKVLFGGS